MTQRAVAFAGISYFLKVYAEFSVRWVTFENIPEM